MDEEEKNDDDDDDDDACCCYFPPFPVSFIPFCKVLSLSFVRVNGSAPDLKDRKRAKRWFKEHRQHKTGQGKSSATHPSIHPSTKGSGRSLKQASKKEGRELRSRCPLCVCVFVHYGSADQYNSGAKARPGQQCHPPGSCPSVPANYNPIPSHSKPLTIQQATTPSSSSYDDGFAAVAGTWKKKTDPTERGQRTVDGTLSSLSLHEIRAKAQVLARAAPPGGHKHNH